MAATVTILPQGIEPTQKMFDGGKRYVARIIQMAIARRIRSFDGAAWEFAAPSLLHPRRQRHFIDFVPELVDLSEGNGYRELMAEL